jgi:drug/metabolite transporter (DMT)-like permease
MVLCWSGNYIAAKIVFREVPAMVAMCLRTMVAGILIIPIYWFQTRGKPRVITARELGLLFALGVCGITGNQFFWTLGVFRTTVVHSSMIMGTTPLFVLVMAGMMRLERITVLKVAGILVALSGVLLLQITRTGGSAAGGPTLLGDFLTMMCALLLAALTAFGKKYKPQSGGIAVNAMGYVAGSILLLPVLWYTGRDFAFSKMSAAAWAGLFYMGAFSSITGYMIYYYALGKIPASRMGAFQYLQPVFATLMAVVLLGEQLTGTAVAAGAVIFAGVFVTERFG